MKGSASRVWAGRLAKLPVRLYAGRAARCFSADKLLDEQLITRLGRKPATAISLADLYKYSSLHDPKQMILNANFVRCPTPPS